MRFRSGNVFCRFAFVLVSMGCVAACARLSEEQSLARPDGNDCQDHVQPLRADKDGVDYYEAVQRMLIGDAPSRAHVVWQLSFAPEEAVSLDERDDGWFVRVARVETPISGGYDEHFRLRIRTGQRVDVVEREIPRELAERVVREWHRVLQRTREEPKRFVINDGVSYLFAAKELRGEDGNLGCGAGYRVLRSAAVLHDYVSAQDSISRWSLRMRLKRTLDRIE